MAISSNATKKITIALIKGYQYFISPLFGPCCRFYPSCSHYATEAVEKWGVIQGLYLTMRRLLKCHPFHSAGYDPVPTKTTK